MQYPGLISLFQVYATGLHVKMAKNSMESPETAMNPTAAHAAVRKPLDGKIPRYSKTTEILIRAMSAGNIAVAMNKDSSTWITCPS